MRKPHQQSARIHDGTERVPMPAHDRAVRDLLDHLAEELAKEYVRLMKEATPTNTGINDEQKTEESR